MPLRYDRIFVDVHNNIMKMLGKMIQLDQAIRI